ncbi:MAG: sodium ion-translocating decarboxylase subunit beta [Lachnospiraceae bacterium]|nr:sodium ion-translocating decarboxylase subunit beta [Lachnospiraceae bacterium]
MNIMTFIQYTIAILELVFFILTIYHLVKGLGTKNYQNLKKYGIVYLILNFIRRVLEFAQKKAVAVSIIGGADGPTSIFLAGKVGAGFFWGTYLIWLLVILAGVGIVIYIRKKK